MAHHHLVLSLESLALSASYDLIRKLGVDTSFLDYCAISNEPRAEFERSCISFPGIGQIWRHFICCASGTHHVVLIFYQFCCRFIMPLELDFQCEWQQLQLSADYLVCTDQSWDGVYVCSETIGQLFESACDSCPGD